MTHPGPPTDAIRSLAAGHQVLWPRAVQQLANPDVSAGHFDHWDTLVDRAPAAVRDHLGAEWSGGAGALDPIAERVAYGFLGHLAAREADRSGAGTEGWDRWREETKRLFGEAGLCRSGAAGPSTPELDRLVARAVGEAGVCRRRVPIGSVVRGRGLAFWFEVWEEDAPSAGLTLVEHPRNLLLAMDPGLIDSVHEQWGAASTGLDGVDRCLTWRIVPDAPGAGPVSPYSVVLGGSSLTAAVRVAFETTLRRIPHDPRVLIAATVDPSPGRKARVGPVEGVKAKADAYREGVLRLVVTADRSEAPGMARESATDLGGLVRIVSHGLADGLWDHLERHHGEPRIGLGVQGFAGQRSPGWIPPTLVPADPTSPGAGLAARIDFEGLLADLLRDDATDRDGGLAPSVTFIEAPPGAGKTTLSLQVGHALAERAAPDGADLGAVVRRLPIRLESDPDPADETDAAAMSDVVRAAADLAEWVDGEPLALAESETVARLARLVTLAPVVPEHLKLLLALHARRGRAVVLVDNVDQLSLRQRNDMTAVVERLVEWGNEVVVTGRPGSDSITIEHRRLRIEALSPDEVTRLATAVEPGRAASLAEMIELVAQGEPTPLLVHLCGEVVGADASREAVRTATDVFRLSVTEMCQDGRSADAGSLLSSAGSAVLHAQIAARRAAPVVPDPPGRPIEAIVARQVVGADVLGTLEECRVLFPADPWGKRLHCLHPSLMEFLGAIGQADALRLRHARWHEALAGAATTPQSYADQVREGLVRQVAHHIDATCDLPEWTAVHRFTVGLLRDDECPECGARLADDLLWFVYAEDAKRIADWLIDRWPDPPTTQR